MVGWHHQLDGYEFEQALGVGDGQGGLAMLQFMGSQRVGHDCELMFQCLLVYSLWELEQKMYPTVV